ncbi:MAG: Rho termination factor N-terminal domain-containing protein [Actinomycetota bacterium]|nr:Rho termination factor N-terminal domain-containing protein [Actinomycetota bacterium]
MASDDDAGRYRDLRDRGLSPRAAAIVTGTNPGPDYTKEELYKMAREADIHGRSRMNKSQLVDALRRAGELP